MRKHWFKTILLSLAIGALLSLLFLLGFFSTWRTKLTDKLFIQGSAPGNIIIIAIDNPSLQALGRWPWDRKIHARLINKIDEFSPLIIGLDVNFPEKSNEASDLELAQAIQNAASVVLPIEGKLKIARDKIITQPPLSPVKKIRDAAYKLGITNTPPDRDGIFRKLPLQVFDDNNQAYQAFAKVIADSYAQKKELYIEEVKTDSQSRLLINYVGKPMTFNTISALDVINEKIDLSMLRDRIVLIGATAPDLHDEQITPVSSGVPMSGVEIHANAINTLITGQFISPLKTVWQTLIFVWLALLVALALIFFRTKIGSIVIGTILAAYIITGLFIFDKGIILDLFYAILAIASTYLAVIVWQYTIEKKEKKHIKGAFSRYVSPDVIDELLSHPDKLKLGGQKKELSILFSDIRSFTTISEKLSPEKLVSLLNKYLTAMTDLIMDARGVVDKYIGDAIMAFWGAPLEQPQHANRACQNALDMIQELDQQRSVWHKEYGIELHVGIGINSGEVIVGNMGSDKRFDYTVMGDAVNLASRLEGITKQYGVKIVVSEFTQKQAIENFTFRYLDIVAVKGKKEGVRIFELVSEKEKTDNKTQKLIKKFGQAIAMYQKQNWTQAIEQFQKLSEKYPNDGPTRTYLARCQELKNNPPDDNWDGIYRLTTK